MDKSNTLKMTRAFWGPVLVAAGVFAIAGAILFEKLGLSAPGVRPVTFVGTLVCIKLGLFTFWPVLTNKGRAAHTALKGVFSPRPRPSSMALWNEHDPRLDLSLFAANVPTFILNQEQRFIEWNPAFELIFGRSLAVRRGGHVNHWYELLDNFRRVPKRTDKLYGEGILPITDRERVTFISKEFGRMVFTRIMTPVIDRGSGRIIGWGVVLNINSVNKRQEFFEKLYSRIAFETKRIRYAASYDGLFDGYSGRRQLIEAHVDALKNARHVLDVGCGTGSLTTALLAEGHKLTAVEKDTHLLRRARERCFALVGMQAQLVRQDLDDLRNVPAERYDGASVMHQLHRLADPAATLKAVHKALKPGGVVTVSVQLAGGGLESLFNAVRAKLEATGHYDNLKHQFTHVIEFERDLAAALPYRFPTREDVRAWLIEAGFGRLEEAGGLENGHTLVVTARK